jgi:hypothetical protein
MNGQCRIRKLMKEKIDLPWTNGGACILNNRPSQRRETLDKMANGNVLLITLQRSSTRGISANSSKLDSFHSSFSIFSLVSPFSATASPGTTGVDIVAIGATTVLGSPLLIASC